MKVSASRYEIRLPNFFQQYLTRLQKLVKGSLILGQVSRINALDVDIALPNNLTGNVPIVAVSEQLTERLQHAAADNSDDGNSDLDDESDIDLKKLFSVGQYVRVYVVSTMDNSTSGTPHRKIELSLRPTEANTGLGADDLVPSSTVMASVVSSEDRGYVMDIGISETKAFLTQAEIDPALNEERLQPGAVFLCSVVGKDANGKIAQLSMLPKRLTNIKAVPSEATTINTFLPGTTADVLVTNIDDKGLAGKIMGHVDATADIIHSGVGPAGVSLDTAYKIGSRVKARIICTFPTAKDPKLGLSLLPHVASLGQKITDKGKKLPTEVLPISSLVENCTVRHVEQNIGLFIDLGVPGLSGFVHISRVKDGKVDALYETSGPYKLGSEHKGRVVGYNEVDGMFQVSFQKSVLQQRYIRLEDVPIGAQLTCDIEKLMIDERGVSGLILKVADGIRGLVPELHMSDYHLQNPDKKFREGMKVKARVLWTDPSKKKMRLTMKKTLVNSDAPVVKNFSEVTVGMQIPGTIVKLESHAARIQFYGNLMGFLPVSEMSEAYIADPKEHFRPGQVVSVHVIDVEEKSNRLVVSCKDPAAFGLDKQEAFKTLQVGDFVSAKVTQKSEKQVDVELQGSDLKAILPVGHLTDKSVSKNRYALKTIAVGQTLPDLMILDKDLKRRSITITQKPSLLAAAKSKTFLTSFDDARQGAIVPGFVRNITQTAVFIEFGARLHALLPKTRLPAESHLLPDFGLHKHQSMEVKILSVIQDLRRIMVGPASASNIDEPNARGTKSKPAPADGLAFGSVTEAKITSIKETQLNVQLVDSEVMGRIDMSQVFNKWSEIDNPKRPLSKFARGNTLKTKIIGVHDSKDHRFLPFSHRSSQSLLELTAKSADVNSEDAEPLAMSQLKVGDQHLAFVNNVASQFLWVNLSPTVRGRISMMEASDDLSLLDDLETNFPIGCALKVRVVAVDAKNNQLDLSARSSTAAAAVDWSTLKRNMTLPGWVTKVNERQVLVKLSEQVSGPVHLPDMVDNYDDVNTLRYKKFDVVRVSVVEVDPSNKRLRLSLRPSRVMSSTLPVEDKEISEFAQIVPGDILRGFVKNVSDKGLFVLLGGSVTALVKISNLSDRFLKNWKDDFQVDQLVKGRILSVDPVTRQVEMSLKSSMVDKDYTPPITLADLKEGQVVTGQVKKVEEFGAFILVDNSADVRGLCHRSEMAEKPVQDATKLYKEGDVVKALVVKIDPKKRRINFSLKPSLLDEDDTDMDSDALDNGALLGSDDEDDSDVEMNDGGAALRILGTDNQTDSDEDEDDDLDEDGESSDEESDEDGDLKSSGLGAGKKSAWSADPFEEASADNDDDDEQVEVKPKKSRKQPEIEVDRTGDLDAHGPQTAFDYERLVGSDPNNSALWIQYMAFQMQVSDLSKAREVAEKATKSIDFRQEAEKLAVWAAYLNLEVTYGSKKTVEDVFKRACQVNDEQEVHERLASMYIQSDKLKVSQIADAILNIRTTPANNHSGRREFVRDHCQEVRLKVDQCVGQLCPFLACHQERAWACPRFATSRYTTARPQSKCHQPLCSSRVPFPQR